MAPKPKTPPPPPLAPAPAAAAERNWVGLTNFQTRTMTAVFLGPMLFVVAVLSELSCACLVFTGVFIAAIEWAGLKRHLKVALLLWDVSATSLTDGPAATEATAATATAPVAAAAAGHLLVPDLPSSPLMKSGVPLRPTEYPLPVPPVTLYTVLKSLGWACLAFAAYRSQTAFMVTSAVYFVVFVCVTVMAHNSLEGRVEQAVSTLSVAPPSVLSSLAGSSGSGADSPHKDRRDSHATDALSAAKKAAHDAKIAQRDYFLSLELKMIAEKQPTEQFLDFSLDIFGILWISGLVYPLFFYGIPSFGVPWAFATLLGNFLNDIVALLVGRAFKKKRLAYAQIFDCTTTATGTAAPERAAGTAAGKKLPLSKATPFQRFVLEGPHHLSPAISPNKSVEGAVAGVLMNAVSFTLCMKFFYVFVLALPDPSILAPRFNSMLLWLLVGFAMGILGVVGDLLQSLLKRAARVKDAGFIVPGHGGILDRLDGALLAFPFMYCIMSVLRAVS